MDELMLWIPYLESLHISAIYIGPLFESSTHGYDTRDFRLIDRRLGTNVSFRSFVDCCHEHGIRVVVDGVFNHTGREFFAFRDLQAHRDQSPYAGWYRNVNFGWGSPLGDSFGYESWHGICLTLSVSGCRNSTSTASASTARAIFPLNLCRNCAGWQMKSSRNSG